MNLFNIILDIEKSRTKFYDNRKLRNKSAEPEIIWTNMIHENFIGNFTEMIETSMLLFSRYEDELERIEEEESEIDVGLKNKISQYFQSALELITLLNSYVGFLKSTLDLSNKEKLTKAILSVEKNYIYLMTSFLKRPYIQEQKPIRDHLASIENANATYRIKTRLVSADSITNDIEIESVLKSSDYFLKTLPSFLRGLFTDIWYEDHLLLAFIQQNGINKIEKLSKIDRSSISFDHTKKIDFLLENDVSEINAYQRVNESKFLLQLAKLRLKSMEIPEANIELKSAIHSLEQVFNIIGMYPSKENMHKLYTETRYLFDEFNLIHLLVSLNLELKSLINAVNEENKKEVLDSLSTIDNMLKRHDFNIDIQYLSALPTIYDNIVSNLELVFSTGDDFEIARSKIDKNFENIERRIVTATNQIVNDFDNLKIHEKDITEIKLISRLDTIEILQITNSLLPEFIPSRNHSNNRFQILEDLAFSVLYELKAYNVSKDNPLKELIFKTKAYHHANQSYFEFNNLGTKDVPISRIKAHYSGSFISANKLQIDLYKSIIQYICISKILPNLYQIITTTHKTDGETPDIYDYWSQRMKNFDKFDEIIQYIIKSSQIIFEHYQIHGTVVAGINWEGIKQVEGLSKAISQYFDALKDLLLGSLSLNLKIEADAIIHFTDAKNTAFKASESLQQLDLSELEIKDAATYIFNFAKFCQESASNPDYHDLKNLPISSAIILLRDLVFSI